MAGMYVLSGTRTSGGKRAGPTIYELNASGEGRSSRDIPRLAAAGVAIAWHAGPGELTTMAVLEVLSGVGLAAEVVVGRRVLQAIMLTQHTSAAQASVWPSAVLLGVITDRIYVLNEGSVVESGTHDELLAAGGTYAELFTLQASPYQ
jgi:hypothetical protein